MDETLTEHLALAKERGNSRAQMRTLLLDAGWPLESVEPYLERTFKTLEKGTVLSTHGLVKSFGDKVVLDGIDLDIKQGEIFGIIGMSGVGKTTLLNSLVGFLRPDKGDVLLKMPNGEVRSIVTDPEAIKSHIGFSTQTPSFHHKLTVRENLLHFGKLYHLVEPDLSRRVNALITLMGISEARDVMASKLSGGMQKRLDIACALVHDPSILVLDEPTADLDPILRKQFWQLISHINSKGTTILLASHFLAEIELLCNRIAILQNKKILELGTAEELRALYSKNYEIIIKTATGRYDKISKGLKGRYVTTIKEENGELIIETAYPEQVLSNIASKVSRGELQGLHVTKPTLGKVFEAVVSR